MPAMTLGDLLDKCTEFEQRLEQFYADVRDRSSDNSVRLLTYYLSRHRWHIPEALSDRSATALAEIRDLNLGDDTLVDPVSQFDVIDMPVEDLKGEKLIAAATNYNKSLADLYSAALTQEISEESVDVLEQLIKAEKRDIVMLKKMLQMHYF